MTYHDFEKKLNAKEIADLEFDLPSLGEAKLKKLREKIEDGESEMLAWGELLSEFLSLKHERINAALRRLTPNQLLTMRDGCDECKQAVHESAKAKAKLYLAQLGLSVDDLVGSELYLVSEPKKRAVAKRLPWMPEFRQDLKAYLSVEFERQALRPDNLKPHFIEKYPDLTNYDISKTKNYLKKNNQLPHA